MNNAIDELIQEVVREIAERQDFLRHLQAARDRPARAERQASWEKELAKHKIVVKLPNGLDQRPGDQNA